MRKTCKFNKKINFTHLLIKQLNTKRPFTHKQAVNDSNPFAITRGLTDNSEIFLFFAAFVKFGSVKIPLTYPISLTIF